MEMIRLCRLALGVHFSRLHQRDRYFRTKPIHLDPNHSITVFDTCQYLISVGLYDFYTTHTRAYAFVNRRAVSDPVTL